MPRLSGKPEYYVVEYDLVIQSHILHGPYMDEYAMTRSLKGVKSRPNKAIAVGLVIPHDELPYLRELKDLEGDKNEKDPDPDQL